MAAHGARAYEGVGRGGGWRDGSASPSSSRGSSPGGGGRSQRSSGSHSAASSKGARNNGRRDVDLAARKIVAEVKKSGPMRSSLIQNVVGKTAYAKLKPQLNEIKAAVENYGVTFAHACFVDSKLMIGKKRNVPAPFPAVSSMEGAAVNLSKFVRKHGPVSIESITYAAGSSWPSLRKQYDSSSDAIKHLTELALNHGVYVDGGCYIEDASASEPDGGAADVEADDTRSTLDKVLDDVATFVMERGPVSSSAATLIAGWSAWKELKAAYANPWKTVVTELKRSGFRAFSFGMALAHESQTYGMRAPTSSDMYSGSEQTLDAAADFLVDFVSTCGPLSGEQIGRVFPPWSKIVSREKSKKLSITNLRKLLARRGIAISNGAFFITDRVPSNPPMIKFDVVVRRIVDFVAQHGKLDYIRVQDVGGLAWSDAREHFGTAARSKLIRAVGKHGITMNGESQLVRSSSPAPRAAPPPSAAPPRANTAQAAAVRASSAQAAALLASSAQAAAQPSHAAPAADVQRLAQVVWGTPGGSLAADDAAATAFAGAPDGGRSGFTGDAQTVGRMLKECGVVVDGRRLAVAERVHVANAATAAGVRACLLAAVESWPASQSVAVGLAVVGHSVLLSVAGLTGSVVEVDFGKVGAAGGGAARALVRDVLMHAAVTVVVFGASVALDMREVADFVLPKAAVIDVSVYIDLIGPGRLETLGAAAAAVVRRYAGSRKAGEGPRITELVHTYNVLSNCFAGGWVDVRARTQLRMWRMLWWQMGR